MTDNTKNESKSGLGSNESIPYDSETPFSSLIVGELAREQIGESVFLIEPGEEEDQLIFIPVASYYHGKDRSPAIAKAHHMWSKSEFPERPPAIVTVSTRRDSTHRPLAPERVYSLVIGTETATSPIINILEHPPYDHGRMRELHLHNIDSRLVDAYAFENTSPDGKRVMADIFVKTNFAEFSDPVTFWYSGASNNYNVYFREFEPLSPEDIQSIIGGDGTYKAIDLDRYIFELIRDGGNGRCGLPLPGLRSDQE